MLDAHCHLDLYPDPSEAAADAEKAGVFTVFVTNLPSAFDVAYPHTVRFKKVRIAVGLHPLNANLHTEGELARFRELVQKTSFIGEVGLDFSRDGVTTRNKQLNSFRFVLQCLEKQAKFVTIHSRQAESAVLDLLGEHYPHPVVFHWYSGAARNLDLAIKRGDFFSINPSMFRSKKGRSLIEQIPRDRALTESDGPFINVGSRTVVPADVHLVEQALGEVWTIEWSTVRTIVARNFQQLMEPLKNRSISGG
jgi:TatD DNase family protein